MSKQGTLVNPFRKAEFDILFGEGIDTAGELLDFGQESGILQRKGAWYSAGKKKLGQGRDRTRQAILEDPELFQKLSEAARG